MKMLLVLLLCLALTGCAKDSTTPVNSDAATDAPAAAAANTNMTTHAFEGFSIALGDNDHYELAEDRVSNSVYLTVYPNYDEENQTPDSLNVVWYNGDASAELEAYEPLEYAALILDNVKETYALVDVYMNNEQVYEASYENHTYMSLTYYELDFSEPLGYELIVPSYQMQFYICMSATDTYIITLTATTADGLQTLLPYLDTLSFE